MKAYSETRVCGEIETPRPLRAPGGQVLVEGWCLLPDSPAAPAVRLTTPASILLLTARTARSDVPQLFPGHPGAAQCGFVITGVLPAGVYLTCFEAELPDGSWVGFKTLTLAVERPSFTAALDEPVSVGVLRDRVRVGGWALQADEPLVALSVRYGHRELPCDLHRPRRDLPELFPHVPQAATAGFESRDFLLAGHGPARLRGRLAGGQTVVAQTKVIFSVATDENHHAELDLTAERIPLPRGCAPVLPGATPTTRPLNILFVLHGSFASNSALHVAALANELTLAGHACTVAVPHDPETLAHHHAPAFRGVTYAEVQQHLVFPNGHGPDIIHAWTTRENVRQLTQSLRAQRQAKLVVHLEDNEQQLLAHTLNRSLSDLEALAPAELDALVPSDFSHPLRGRAFLDEADAVTVIVETLREFAPVTKPCLTLTPAADARYFFPRPIPREFRAIFDIDPATTVLFYHGNVHASNAAEVRELYRAVLQLNEGGDAVTLIRTGLDRVDFLGPLAEKVAPYVLELGQILQHQHLPPLLALADIFVQPGEADAFNNYRFPSKLPEFFAIGRPVILPRTNLGLALEHGKDAYVLEKADAAGIAQAVRALRADHVLYEKLAHGATAFAARRFSWRRSAETLANFYAELTA